jgi:hypothetical protein
MKDEIGLKEDIIIHADETHAPTQIKRLQIGIKTRPYPKYSRRRGEKKNERSMQSEGFREEVATKVRLLAKGECFQSKVQIVCHFFLAEGDGGSGFDGKNLYANVEDALVDSDVIVDDNCKRVRSGVWYVYEHGEHEGDPGVHIFIEEKTSPYMSQAYLQGAR